MTCRCKESRSNGEQCPAFPLSRAFCLLWLVTCRRKQQYMQQSLESWKSEQNNLRAAVVSTLVCSAVLFFSPGFESVDPKMKGELRCIDETGCCILMKSNTFMALRSFSTNLKALPQIHTLTALQNLWYLCREDTLSSTESRRNAWVILCNNDPPSESNNQRTTRLGLGYRLQLLLQRQKWCSIFIMASLSVFVFNYECNGPLYIHNSGGFSALISQRICFHFIYIDWNML